MKRLRSKKLALAVAAVVALLGLLTTGTIIALHSHQPTAADPFDAKALASVKFPLYYPTQVPHGFRIDPKSVNFPQDGVVVFNLVDDKGRKIYISQEARSSTYNYGGFYNGIEQGQQFKAHLGQAIVGHLGNGQTTIGSLVTNKTWVITNTKSSTAQPKDLKQVLQSLASSH